MGLEAAIIGGLISGVGSLAGSAMTNATNEELASDANSTSIELANTAHQREVKDLKAAGLNPILSAGGSGAASPAQILPAISSLGEAASRGITDWSAIKQGEAIDASVEKTRADAKLSNALSLKAAADTTSALTASKEAEARIPTYAATTDFTRAETAVKRSGALGRFLGSDVGSVGSSFLSNSVDTIADKLNDVISSVHVNSAKQVKPHSTSFRYSRDSANPALEHFTPN